MFKLFKRSNEGRVVPAVAPKEDERPLRLKERRLVPRPLPSPEVVEGNGGETDWGLWEEAQREQVTVNSPPRKY
jgi:hypothetical protein